MDFSKHRIGPVKTIRFSYPLVLAHSLAFFRHSHRDRCPAHRNGGIMPSRECKVCKVSSTSSDDRGGVVAVVAGVLTMTMTAVIDTLKNNNNVGTVGTNMLTVIFIKRAKIEQQIVGDYAFKTKVGLIQTSRRSGARRMRRSGAI